MSLRIAVTGRRTSFLINHGQNSCHRCFARDATAAISSQNLTAYCRDLVQRHDYESHLVAQFWPKELQSSYYALRAFYVGPPPL